MEPRQRYHPMIVFRKRGVGEGDELGRGLLTPLMHMEKRSKFQTFSAHSISTTIWPPGGTTCISWKFSHQVTPLAIVGKLTTRTRNLNYLKIWPPGGTICISWKFWPPSGSTCISWKFGDQVVPLVLVINLATRWRHLY